MEFAYYYAVNPTWIEELFKVRQFGEYITELYQKTRGNILISPKGTLEYFTRPDAWWKQHPFSVIADAGVSEIAKKPRLLPEILAKRSLTRDLQLYTGTVQVVMDFPTEGDRKLFEKGMALSRESMDVYWERASNPAFNPLVVMHGTGWDSIRRWWDVVVAPYVDVLNNIGWGFKVAHINLAMLLAALYMQETHPEKRWKRLHIFGVGTSEKWLPAIWFLKKIKAPIDIVSVDSATAVMRTIFSRKGNKTLPRTRIPTKVFAAEFFRQVDKLQAGFQAIVMQSVEQLEQALLRRGLSDEGQVIYELVCRWCAGTSVKELYRRYSGWFHRDEQWYRQKRGFVIR